MRCCTCGRAWAITRARGTCTAPRSARGRHAAQLPEDPEALERLPGIGRSTAAAIVALALGRRATILDGNVRRVLARYFGIEGAPDSAAVQSTLWQHAQACTPERRVAIYTQAIMDFGATLCTRRRRCACIARSRTVRGVAYRPRRGIADAAAARERPTRQVVMLLAVREDGGVLLRRRPARGVWAQLWTPPEFTAMEHARAFCTPASCASLQVLPLVRHAFTHFDLEITPLRATWTEADVGEPAVAGQAGFSLWYDVRQPARVGIPAPIATLSSLATH